MDSFDIRPRPPIQRITLPLVPDMKASDLLAGLNALIERVSVLGHGVPLAGAHFQPSELPNRADIVFSFVDDVGMCCWERMILGSNGLCSRCEHPPDDHEKERCSGCAREEAA